MLIIHKLYTFKFISHHVIAVFGDCSQLRRVCLFPFLIGILCVIIGAGIVALDSFASPILATFFDADAAQELDEVYTSKTRSTTTTQLMQWLSK